MKRIVYILLYSLLLLGCSFESIQLLAQNGQVSATDQKHASNKNDHHDTFNDEVIFVKHRNQQQKAAVATRKHTNGSMVWASDFSDLQNKFPSFSITGKPKQVPGFGQLYRYQLY